MDRAKPTEPLLPDALIAEIEAMAVAEHRPAGEMLREAVERYLDERRVVSRSNHIETPILQREPAEAAQRIRERRKRHPLPAGMSIRDLMTFGRA